MRSISATLVSAQQSGAADPYIYLSIKSTDYSARLLSLEHIEEPYRDRATIVLTNSDRHFNSNDLKGYSFSPGYGYVTVSGNMYCGDGLSEATPKLWVKTQSMVSMEGKLICLLECEGGWMKMRETIFIKTADAPYLEIDINDPLTTLETVYELIQEALALAGFTLSYESIDTIIQAFQPIMTANPLDYESVAGFVYELIQMTKCFLRQTENENFEVVFPQTTDSVQETYYSYQAPYFKEYVEKTNVLIPNSIAVFCNRDPNGQWDTDDYPLITGTAEDEDSIATLLASGYSDDGRVWQYNTAPFIGNQTDADNRAAAILARLKAETLAGRLILPFHDCRVELYDKVQVADKRGI